MTSLILVGTVMIRSVEAVPTVTFGTLDSYETTYTQTTAAVSLDFPPPGTQALPDSGIAPGPVVPDPALLAAKKSSGDNSTTSPDVGPYGVTAASPSGNGISYTGILPPDPTIAAGTNRLLLSVNSTIAVYTNDSISSVASSRYSDWIFQQQALFIPNLPSNLVYFDPQVYYAADSQRFLFVIAAKNDDTDRSFILFGASRTSDPGGQWCAFALDHNTVPGKNIWADQPKLGFDSQAIYITSNDGAFDGPSPLANSLWVIPRTALINCIPQSNVAARRFTNLHNVDGSVALSIAPAQTSGASVLGYMINATEWPDGSHLTLWQTCPGCPPETMLGRAALTVQAYGSPADAPQSGTTKLLDTGDGRMMNATYDAASHQLWTVHSSAANPSQSVRRSAVRVYAIDTLLGTIVQSQISSSSQARFNPAVMYDPRNGGVAVTYSQSGSSAFPSMVYATLSGGVWTSAIAKSSSTYYAAQTSSSQRWGDFAGAAIDPNTSGAVWLYNEYAASSSNWSTWIARVTT